jgi:hypothetical protein
MTDTSELRKLNLWQKIAHVQATLGPIAKNKSTTTGPKYDYVTAERVFSTLQARLGTIGIVIESEIVEQQTKPGNGEVNAYALRITVRNADTPSETTTCHWIAEARNNSDKGANGASTIGLKYFLLRLFLSSDEKDPEQIEQEELRTKASAWYQRVQAAQHALEGKTPTPQQVERLRTLVAHGQDLTPDRPVGYAIPDEDLLRECLAIAEYLRIGR